MEALPTHGMATHGAEAGDKGMAAHCAEAGGKGTTTKATPAHAGDPTPKRVQETDLLVFDVYIKTSFTLAEVEAQVRACRIPAVTWAENFVALEDDPTKGVSRLRVTALLKGGDEKTTNIVEETLKNILVGNKGAVSSIAYRGNTKSF